MKKLVIILFTLLLLTGCGQETIASPVREEIKATVVNLGIKKSDSKPVILINNPQETLYLGETDYDFDVEAYSDNGEVTITFDDSTVDFNTANSYQVKVLAADPFVSNEDNADLILKTKPVPVVNTSNSGAGDSSGSSYGEPSVRKCRVTCLGTFCSYEDFLAYAESQYAIGGLSDRFINNVRSDGGATW